MTLHKLHSMRTARLEPWRVGTVLSALIGVSYAAAAIALFLYDLSSYR